MVCISEMLLKLETGVVLLLIFLISENFSYMDNSDFVLYNNYNSDEYMMIIKEGISAKHRQNYMAIISPSSYLRKLTGSFDNDDINVDMSKVV